MEGTIPRDLRDHVPKVRQYKDARIPSVWRREDVESLLSAVDRSSAKGKRDYAILMLTCRLGLRVGDVRTLRLEDLNWNEARMEISQDKTKKPLTLPLIEEVGEALIDYLRHGRPKTKHREVFLKLRAPFGPYSCNNNLHAVITTYRRRAGIKLQSQASKGLHSLRHTLATHLLEEGIPLEVISDILGHVSLESTQVYAKVDINALRTAALDCREVIDA
jgi:integrase